MRPKTVKNNKAFWLALMAFLAWSALVPKAAQAYNFYSPVLIQDNTINAVCPGPQCSTVISNILNNRQEDIIVCPNTSMTNYNGQVVPNFGLLRRVMPCVKESIVWATNQFIYPVMQRVSSAVCAACILAVLIWGFALATGKQTASKRDFAVLIMKLLAVSIFTFDFGASYFGNMFGMMLDCIDDLLGITGSYITDYSALANNLDCPDIAVDPNVMKVWDTMDCGIETLIGGIYSNVSLQYGIVGFLFACLFTSAIGVFIALLGSYIILGLFNNIVQALFIFVASYMGFATMMIISPIFITCILFSGTKTYFDKWLQFTIRYMLQPVVLFAFLSTLMAAMDAVLFTGPNSVYRAIAGDSIVDTSCFATGVTLPGAAAENRCGFNLGDWLEVIGVYGTKDALASGTRIDESVFKSTIDPMLGVVGVDTGTNAEVKGIVNTTILNWRTGALQSMGIGGLINHATGQPTNLNVTKQNIVVTGIDLPKLAYMGGFITQAQLTSYNNGNTVPAFDSYIKNLVFAVFMAAVTIYIFVVILGQLPFIVSGISGNAMIMNPFQQMGNNPASNVMAMLQHKMGGKP